MKKKLYSQKLMQGAIALFAASLMVGCNVDASYDLTNIDSDNIGIGSDDSVLDIPLATVKLKLESLETNSASPVASRATDESSSDGLSATEMMEYMKIIDAFLPSDLTGTDYEAGIDISKLSGDTEADKSYTSGLVDILIDEVTVDEEKRADLCEILIDAENDETNTEYDAVIQSMYKDLEIPEITPSTTVADLTSDLGTALNDSSKSEAVKSLSSTMTDVVTAKAENIQTDYSVTQDLSDDVSLGDDVLDILLGEDGKGYIYLVTDLDHNIPMDVKITPSMTLDGSEINIGDIANIDKPEANEKLTDSEIEALVNGFTINADIHINNYNPAAGDLEIEGKVIKMKIVARKGGSISI